MASITHNQKYMTDRKKVPHATHIGRQHMDVCFGNKFNDI